MKQYVSKYDAFINTFGVREIQTIKTDNHNQFYGVLGIPEELVVIKIDRNGLETLIDLISDYNQTHKKINEEKCLRDAHPSLDDLYSKYLMLLEICR